MSIKAVIDIGTNSVKLLVMGLGDGDGKVLSDSCVITRLGEGVAESGVISETSAERTIAAISGMLDAARELRCDSIAAIGTQALRRASNSGEFIGDLQKRCGLRVQIISGVEEARMSFFAAITALPPIVSAEGVLVFDVGGGSSEIVSGNTEKIHFQNSLPIGALALYQEFFSCFGEAPVPKEAILSARNTIRARLKDSAGKASWGSFVACVGVGGTIVTLMEVKRRFYGFESDSQLDAGEIERQISAYASMGPSDRLSRISGLQKGREDIILPGACIVAELLAMADVASLTVTERGLRYGVIKSPEFFGRDADLNLHR